MIYGLIVIIWLVCGFQILRHSGIKRLLYFFVGIFFVPATLTVIPISLLQGHSFYAFMFILSMLWHKEFKLQTFMSCPMFKSLMFIFVTCLLIGLFDLRIGVFRGVFRGITNFINTYFLFFVGWTSFKIDDRIDGGISEQFLKKFLPITLIFTIFGLWSAFTKDNPILDAVGLEGRFLSEHMENYRTFRVTGFTVSSSVYGLACSVLFMSSYALMKNYSKVQIIAVVMLLLNIFLSATRAAIIPFLIGIIFFIILDKGISKIIKYTLIGIILIVLVYPLLPESITGYFGQMFDSIVDVMSPHGTGGEKYGGSTVDARAMQIGAAMEFLKEKPLFGHGFAYFNEVLSGGKKHPLLLGMESYLCFIGVEYGLVYFIAILSFFISVIMFFIHHRKSTRIYSDLGLSLTLMLIPYLIFAWVGGIWYFIMPILGLITRVIYNINYGKVTFCIK